MSTLRLAPLVVLASGCGIGQMMQLQTNIKASNAQAAANFTAAQANAHTEKYVVTDGTWVCPTEQAALAGAACDGGKRIAKNHTVTVVGQAPTAGVWRVSTFDASGEHFSFTVASALNELPDLAPLEAYSTDVAARFPVAKRIPINDLNFVDLLEQPKAYKGHVVVLRQPSHTMTNMDFKHDTFTFTIPIPVMTGSRWSALAQFELHNHELTSDFEAGTRSYSCGPSYCDDFVIVAELTGRTVDRVDEDGSLHRLPVFAVRELGARFGSYKPE